MRQTDVESMQTLCIKNDNPWKLKGFICKRKKLPIRFVCANPPWRSTALKAQRMAWGRRN